MIWPEFQFRTISSDVIASENVKGKIICRTILDGIVHTGFGVSKDEAKHNLEMITDRHLADPIECCGKFRTSAQSK